MTLDPSIRARWIADNKPLEGAIPWPYLCTSRVFTFAHGVTATTRAQAHGYRWVRRGTTDPATPAEVDAAWDALMLAPAEVRERIAQLGAGEARRHVQIELPPAEVERATLTRYDATAADLLRRYPALSSWPVEVQTVCMSIAWAAGSASPYPRMYAALHRHDWRTARAECLLRVVRADGTRNKGLVARNDWHLRLFDRLLAREEADAPTLPPAPDAPPSDTEPMTDAMRSEVLGLVAATLDQSARDALAEGYRRR
jgi:GH24 family phage-related lysozyme (muramidase)